MSTGRQQQIRDIVDAALGITSGERAAFLGARCQGDSELRREVERLLRQHEDQDLDTTSLPAGSMVRTTSLVEGQIIAGRYRIMRLIGRGGMGEVYEAEDTFLHESIGLKTLRADYASDRAIAWFQKEIQLARKVTHPNICRVFEVGQHESPDGVCLRFFTMELLRGETLAARIRRGGRLSREEAFPIVVQMAEGLAAAHAIGVVHTDFKSSNVILVPAPGGTRAVITDFGLARLDPGLAAEGDTRTMSGTLQIAGTVAYMSPEQLTGGTLTSASDIYSFGIVLFEMATGQLPFDDRHVIHSAMQRASDHAVAIRPLAPDIDPRWETAISHCLRKDPEKRFRSASELADCFRHSAWRMPMRYWTRREWVGASLAAGVPAVTGAGLWVWLRRPYVPQAAAVSWYQKGVAALHAMTYETARKALVQAVTADPRFALAHASLARAYDELDYTDLAKDSMIQAVTLAQESTLASMDATRLQALRFMVSREYDRAAPLFRRLQETARGREQSSAALECGWLAQKRDDTAGAAAEYARAVKLDPGYAAAHLRLGVILGRQAKDEMALKEFTEAEKLYNASSDIEGVTETLIQKASLLNRRRRAAEAMPVIERALAVARAVDNRYQEIELLGWQGVAARNLGDNERASKLAQQAIDAAISEKMDNLATSGLLDLGTSFFFRSEYAAAEARYRQALEQARRGKVRRLEMRALSNLASLCMEDHRPEEAKKFIQEALPFYRQAGFRRELLQVSAILGGALEQLAEYDEGIRILREALTNAADFEEPPLEAEIREKLGHNLRGQGAWPEALAEYERARKLNGGEVTAKGGVPSGGVPAALDRVYCAQIYWRLGRRQEAEQALSECERLLQEKRDQDLVSKLKITRAEIALADGRTSEAAAAVKYAPAASGREMGPDLPLIESLVLIRTGKVTEGLPRTKDLVGSFEKAKLAGWAGSARLSTAEALLASRERGPALEWALGALEFFEPRRIWESIFRGRLVAAHAAQDSGVVSGHLGAARAALDQLSKAWPAQSLEGYRRRPDIRRLREDVGL